MRFSKNSICSGVGEETKSVARAEKANKSAAMMTCNLTIATDLLTALLKRFWGGSSTRSSLQTGAFVKMILQMKSMNGSKGIVLAATLALAGFAALTGCQSTEHSHEGHDHSKHS